MKALILARDLENGGTQRQFVELAKGLRERGHEVVLAAFYPGGVFESELSREGIEIACLDKAGRWDIVGFIVRLARVLRGCSPDLIYSFLDGPNFMSAIMKIAGVADTKLVWGIRSSYVDWSHYDGLGYLTHRISAWLSPIPDAIIYNSYSGLRTHVHNGFKNKSGIVIENGIDLRSYRPDSADIASTRRLWGVNNSKEQFVVGSVGRYDGMKDLHTLLAAAKQIMERRRNVRFVYIGGGGSDEYRKSIENTRHRLGLDESFILTEYSSQMRSVYNALDLFVSSSLGEGFSNVLAEAMASGTPCVATAVGDSDRIVGDTGLMVPPGDIAAMVEAIDAMLERIVKNRPLASQLARDRIAEKFSLERMLDKTENALNQIVQDGAAQ